MKYCGKMLLKFFPAVVVISFMIMPAAPLSALSDNEGMSGHISASAPLPNILGAASDIKTSTLGCKDCNIIIISLTNTRKDHMGIYGYKKNISPGIDDFFKKSLVFENAFAPTSWTFPVAASFFSSLFPFSHGVMNRFGSSRLNDDVKTFAQVLKENGYATAAFTGDGDYNRSFNLYGGFDVYADSSNYSDFGIDLLAGEGRQFLSIGLFTRPAIEWIKKNKGKKFFLFAQGFDNHCPFSSKPASDKIFDNEHKKNEARPDKAELVVFRDCVWTLEQSKPVYQNGKRYWPARTGVGTASKTASTDMMPGDVLLSDQDIERMIVLYDEKIARSDAYVNDILRFVEDSGLLNNTLVVFMSEHGDLFGEHGRFMRCGLLGGTFYDPALNFPFLLRHPKIDSQIRVRELIQTVDLLPTFVEMLQLKDPASQRRAGKSAVPAILSGKAINEYVYGGANFKAVENDIFEGLTVSRYIRSKDWKLIIDETFDTAGIKKRSESYELYRISEDPEEKTNLFFSEKGVGEDLKKKLDFWTERQKVIR